MFVLGEIQRIRNMRRNGVPVGEIARRFSHKTRDQINEAWWATLRRANDAAARDYVNQVLAYQEVGIPLINGKPQQAVARSWNSLRLPAMF